MTGQQQPEDGSKSRDTFSVVPVKGQQHGTYPSVPRSGDRISTQSIHMLSSPYLENISK